MVPVLRAFLERVVRKGTLEVETASGSTPNATRTTPDSYRPMSAALLSKHSRLMKS